VGNAKVDGSDGNALGRPMQKVINELIQLQELCVARAQYEASTAGKRNPKLEASIESLARVLPPEIGSQFHRLQQKGLLIIVPAVNNVCTACGITLPKSLVQAVRMAEALHHCPNCARILYYQEVQLRSIGKRLRRGAPPKAGIARFSAPELMIPDLRATTREEVLAELSEKLEAEGFIDDAAHVLEEAIGREAISSTAVDQGLAFPHVRGVEGGGLTLTLGISRKGIRFDGDARSLTRVFFFVVIPTSASAFYLKLLAGLTQSFREKDHRDTLIAAETPEALWKALVRITRNTVK
jgi:mannitol/fructose-specific phosphotransferase system IIA component (Ntr-type)